MSHNDELRSREHPVKEDMRWQRRENIIQRMGEKMLMGIVLLGACGLFAQGFLSNSETQSPDGAVNVQYERFGRVKSNMNMNVRISQQTGATFTLIIGGGALDKLEIQTLQPQPREAFTSGNELRLTFASHDFQSQHSVWLGLQPQTAGKVTVSVSIAGHKPAMFSQWIYP